MNILKRDIEKASIKESVKFGRGEFDPELAMILGEPSDARKAYAPIVEAICDTAVALPTDYVYYHTSRLPTDRVTVITSTGAATQNVNSLVAPNAFTFIDLASNEEQVSWVDLAARKEDVIARLNKSIETGMNNYELYYVLQLLDSAATAVSQAVTLGSGETRFDFTHAVQMLQHVSKYGDQFVLLCGDTVYQDYLLWEFNDNKNVSLKAQLKEMGVEVMRVPTFSLTIDGGATNIMTATKAFMVAKQAGTTVNGKPLVMVRRDLGEITGLAGIQREDGSNPTRLIIKSMAPVATGSTNTRKLAAAFVGFEVLVAAAINPYAISSFTRA